VIRKWTRQSSARSSAHRRLNGESLWEMAFSEKGHRVLRCYRQITGASWGDALREAGFAPIDALSLYENSFGARLVCSRNLRLAARTSTRVNLLNAAKDSLHFLRRNTFHRPMPKAKRRARMPWRIARPTLVLTCSGSLSTSYYGAPPDTEKPTPNLRRRLRLPPQARLGAGANTDRATQPDYPNAQGEGSSSSSREATAVPYSRRDPAASIPTGTRVSPSTQGRRVWLSRSRRGCSLCASGGSGYLSVTWIHLIWVPPLSAPRRPPPRSGLIRQAPSRVGNSRITLDLVVRAWVETA